MPKIRITEKDGTGRVQQGLISNTVFVPVQTDPSCMGAEYASTYKFNPVLCSSIEELEAVKDIFNPYASGASTEVSGLGFRLCIRLLGLGFQVLVAAVPVPEATPGEDAMHILSGDNAENGDKYINWEKLADRGMYDIRFITLGAYRGFTQEMIDCAAKRGDCVALINIDELQPNFDYSIDKVRKAFEPGAINGEYAAGFTPWFKSKAVNNGGCEEAIPAAFGYLFAYGEATKNSPEWYAIAGFQRGVIPGLSSLCHEYSSAEIEMLQARAETKAVDLDEPGDNVGVAINPIANIRPAGPIIFGNRTLRENDATKKLIATSFLNVRNLVSMIKKQLYDASRKYTFEQNNELLWINFQAYVKPLLDSMQSGNGILGYQFIRLHTDAKARLKARLNIVPIEAVEDFDLEVYLTDDLNVAENS